MDLARWTRAGRSRCPDRHRRLERPCGRSGTRSPAQVHPASAARRSRKASCGAWCPTDSCVLAELGLAAEHDYPYAAITPAALLEDYKPLDPDKASISADIQPGDKIYGPVVCAKVLECEAAAATVPSTPARTSATATVCP
ncbi:MAG: hypothetical protein ACLSHO_10965 [Dysosmobacter sp.]